MMYWYHYVLIVLIIVILYLFIAYMFYRKIFIDYKKNIRPLVDQDSDFYKPSYDWFQKIPKDDVFIRSYDNLKLHGYYLPSLEKSTNKLAIVIHGYKSKSEDMIIIAKLYSDLGFKVLLIDLRGHGQSEGSFTSMGHYEKYDLKKWINYALRNYGTNTEIYLHGVSMGAAISTLITDFKVKENIKFMVLDSGFTTFPRSLYHSLKCKALVIFIPGISIFTHFIHNFRLRQIAPIKKIKTSDIPFLIIQGEKDKPVPPKMAEQLYSQAKVEQKSIIMIPEAPHAKAFEVADSNRNEQGPHHRR